MLAEGNYRPKLMDIPSIEGVRLLKLTPNIGSVYHYFVYYVQKSFAITSQLSFLTYFPNVTFHLTQKDIAIPECCLAAQYMLYIDTYNIASGSEVVGPRASPGRQREGGLRTGRPGTPRGACNQGGLQQGRLNHIITQSH